MALKRLRSIIRIARGFRGAVRVRQQLRELFVEQQSVAELGEGVGARLGRSFGHIVGADQPAIVHRYGLDPERAAVRQGDLAIALAVLPAGIGVDAIDEIGVAEQFLEYRIWKQQFAVGPDDRDRAVHAHEGVERQLGR